MSRNRRRTVVLGAVGGAPRPVFFGAGTLTAASGTNANTPWPVGHQALDVGLLFVETANEAVATPSGWNTVTNGSQGVGVAAAITATRLQVFWRRATNGSEANAAVAGSTDHKCCVILGFRNVVATGAPFNISAGDTDVLNLAVTIPGGTSTVDKCLLVAAVSNMTDSVAATPQCTFDAPYSKVFDGNINNGNGGGLSVATLDQVTAGVFAACTGTLATISAQGRVSLALAPA